MAELSVELWAVTTIDISGVPSTSVSSSRDQAISHFLQLAYLFAHAAPDQRFKVVGDDFDAALTGLHIIWDSSAGPLCLASLTRPGSERCTTQMNASFELWSIDVSTGEVRFCVIPSVSGKQCVKAR